MIVISAGIQKAGTGWYFNLTNDLLLSARNQDARLVRDKFELDDLLSHHNCNMGELSDSNLKRLEVLHYAGFTFAVKTHSGPTNALMELVGRGTFKITYIYRDPRDFAISAFELGQKLRSRGRMYSFAKLRNMDNAFIFAKDVVNVWS